MGWFFGFKLHLVSNDRGELLAVRVTPGNVDDREPVPQWSNGCSASSLATKATCSKALREQLRLQGVELITPKALNMKNQLMLLADKFLFASVPSWKPLSTS